MCVSVCICVQYVSTWYPELLRTSDSCGGPGAVRANQGCQVRGVSSDTLVRLASGLDARCVKKQCGWLGCVSEDA